MMKLLTIAALTLSSDAFLMPGTQAPNFSNVDAVLNLETTKVSLDDYKGKNLVIFFYPGDFTTLSPLEIQQINDDLFKIKKLNSEVIAVSSDKTSRHLKWARTPRQIGGVASKYGLSIIIPNAGLDFPLLSDTNQDLIDSYGASVDNRRCTSNLFKQTVCSKCDFQTGNKIQSGFVILDKLQKVRYVDFNDNNVAHNPQKIIQTLQSLENGETKCEKQIDQTYPEKEMPFEQYGEFNMANMNKGTGVVKVQLGSVVQYRMKQAKFERDQYTSENGLELQNGAISEGKICLASQKQSKGCFKYSDQQRIRANDENYKYQQKRRECLHKATQQMVTGQIAIVNCPGAYDNAHLDITFYRYMVEVVSWKLDL